VIPRAVFLANKPMLESGDIIGFVSHQPDLDYFHAGLVAFAPDNVLLLRHASESHGRVVDERIERFFERYSVRYVTLVRPQEPPAAL
jgi:N-acetylmuramoyl-L-alanine amidase-like